MASSQPSSDDSRKIPSHSGATTSIWELTSQASDVSSNLAKLNDAEDRIKLLQLQLRQRTAEIERLKIDQEIRDSEQQKEVSNAEFFKNQAACLQLVADNLREVVRICQQQQKVHLESFQRMFADQCQNSQDKETRMNAELLNLRVSLSSVKKDFNIERCRAEKFSASLTQMEKALDIAMHRELSLEAELLDKKSELSTLKRETEQLRYKDAIVHSNLKSDFEQKLKFATAERKAEFEEREKEYGVTLTRIRNEMNFVRDELSHREKRCLVLTEHLNQLIKENKRLMDINSNLRHSTDDEVSELKKEISKCRQDIDALNDENSNLKLLKTSSSPAMEAIQAKLEETQALLRAHRAAMFDLQRSEASSSSKLPDLRRLTMEVAELREEIRSLELQRDEEREQRMKLGTIVVDLAADLKRALQMRNH